ncbi:biotin--[acetyl-CoA-carboxylase] ligase [bacterium]|nr:biotin--[acetyl-CoA-carboxylase] ligase [bacterium]
MKILGLEEIDSTNNYAKMNIDSFEDKTVIYAKRQNSGRGRLNRSWVDLGDGNLFMSIVLKPSNSFNEIYPNITQYLSVSLCKVLECYGLKPQIKWPNDVLIDGKKIAGILSETVMEGHLLKGLVLGIGVNLNSCQKDLESIENKIATSLNLEIGQDIDLNAFMAPLLNEFFANYDEFLNSGFKLIKDEYISRTCFLNKEIRVQVFNNIKTGVAKSINDKGELVLLSNDNNEFVLTIGDIL